MSEQEARVSDLVAIAKRNGEFRKNWGLWMAAFLYMRSLSAARPRSFLWSGFAAVVTAMSGIWIKLRT